MIFYLILGLVLLAAFLTAGRKLASIPAAQIAQHARFGGVAMLGLLGMLLMLTGRFGAGMNVLALASRAMSRNGLGGGVFGRGFGTPPGFDDVGSHSQAQAKPSIRTQFLDMQLEQATGAIEGRFIDGPYKGQALDGFSQAELVETLANMEADPESVRLMEAYLDRAFAGWREDHDQGARGRSTGSSDAGGMSEDEAYEILGLESGATADAIRSAHRRLMVNIHPDRGGSTYLAAKVNLAKDILLKLHG